MDFFHARLCVLGDLVLLCEVFRKPVISHLSVHYVAPVIDILPHLLHLLEPLLLEPVCLDGLLQLDDFDLAKLVCARLDLVVAEDHTEVGLLPSEPVLVDNLECALIVPPAVTDKLV